MIDVLNEPLNYGVSLFGIYKSRRGDGDGREGEIHLFRRGVQLSTISEHISLLEWVLPLTRAPAGRQDIKLAINTSDLQTVCIHELLGCRPDMAFDHLAKDVCFCEWLKRSEE